MLQVKILFWNYLLINEKDIGHIKLSSNSVFSIVLENSLFAVEINIRVCSDSMLFITEYPWDPQKFFIVPKTFMIKSFFLVPLIVIL